MSKFDLSRPVPLLLVGDCPPDAKTQSGLGRITLDLARILSRMPEFQVGWLGRLALGSARYPWAQYSLGPHEQWGEERLREVWTDLAQGRKGVIMTVWDASRLLWLGQPQGEIAEWLGCGEVDLWGYFMVDGPGIHAGVLPMAQWGTIDGYARALLASSWGLDLAEESAQFFGQQGKGDLDWLPHPLDLEVFRRRGRDEIRSSWDLADNDVLIGMVMANQERKSWATALEALALVAQTLAPKKLKIWLRTDVLVPTPSRGYWDINALLIENALDSHVLWEDRLLRDEEMAMRYSACDATLLVSGGEGFAYPVAESLACGTPCVTSSWGAQAELTSGLCHQFHPRATEVRTIHAIRRSVHDARDVAQALMAQLALEVDHEKLSAGVGHLAMESLGVQWSKWVRKGLEK